MANWKIAEEPDGAVPIVGEVYQIQDVRKGTFIGKIISVSGEFAEVKRIEGTIHWASFTHSVLYGSQPKEVSIRDTLVYLIPQATTKGEA